MDPSVDSTDTMNQDRLTMMNEAIEEEATAAPALKGGDTPPHLRTGANSNPVGGPASTTPAMQSDSMTVGGADAGGGDDDAEEAPASMMASDQDAAKPALVQPAPCAPQPSLKRKAKQPAPTSRKKQKLGPRPDDLPVLGPPPPENDDTRHLQSLLQVRPLHLQFESHKMTGYKRKGKALELQISGVDLLHQRRLAKVKAIPVLSLPQAPTDASPTDAEMTHEVRVQGDVLEDVWSTLTPARKLAITTRLGAIVDSMRKTSVTGTPGPVGSAAAGPYSLLMDKHAHNTYYAVREAPDDEQFTAFLLSTLYEAVPRPVASALASKMRKQTLILAHGDLSLRNIIVRGEKIVAIIGWDCAGWYPHWWDYVKFFEAPTREANGDWYDYASNIFSMQHPSELAVYQGLVRCQRR